MDNLPEAPVNGNPHRYDRSGAGRDTNQAVWIICLKHPKLATRIELTDRRRPTRSDPPATHFHAPATRIDAFWPAPGPDCRPSNSLRTLKENPSLRFREKVASECERTYTEAIRAPARSRKSHGAQARASRPVESSMRANAPRRTARRGQLCRGCSPRHCIVAV